MECSNRTGGANGIAGIAPVEILGFSFDSRGRMYGLALVVALASTQFMRRLFLRPIGRAIDSVADNPALAESTGLGVHRLQVFSFVLVFGLAAFGGILQAHYCGYIYPASSNSGP